MYLFCSSRIYVITLETEASQATTSFTAAVDASQVEEEIISESSATSHVQKAHPP
jgi:hypothetical protein